MPPKKQKTKDIRSFFNKTDSPGSSSSTNTGSAQPGEAKGSQTATPTKVKKEDNCDSPDGHLHRFKVKFSRTDLYEYIIDCDRPRTVLEAIQSSEHYSKMIKCSDVNIVIQLGKSDNESIVATHCPCSCISDGEPLIISWESEKVEEAQGQHCQPIHSRDKYSVFYIDTVGGLFTRKKKLFRNSAVKQFKFLCVYGEKGTTVEEALRRDGRFIDDLGAFTLSDNDNPNCIIGRKQKVDKLDQKEFKIRLPRKKRANDEEKQENSGASSNLQQTCGAKAVLDVIKQRGISVRKEVEKRGSVDDIGEIRDILRQQFPGLKELMESRFPDNSYKEALNLRKENFGKIQQSFSEVHRVKKLLKMGESVCKVIVGDVRTGTGFVLFDNFIVTNAHLFKGYVEKEKLKEGINVFAVFNYEVPEPFTNSYYFQLAQFYRCSGEDELDYAIIELNPEGQKPNETTQTKKMKVPPGLLKTFGPMPQNGEACIIGHPAGEVKQMDPTCIIKKERRRQAVNDHLHQYKEHLFIVHNISQIIKDQGIDNIMMGGKIADNVVTYNTFMYHGSSGSPVFDVDCRVFGLHTAGFHYEFNEVLKGSVIEFAQPLLTIFEHFVSILKERKYEELLKRVKKEAKGNRYLEEVVRLKSTDNDERSDSDESMETD